MYIMYINIRSWIFYTLPKRKRRRWLQTFPGSLDSPPKIWNFYYRFRHSIAAERYFPFYRILSFFSGLSFAPILVFSFNWILPRYSGLLLWNLLLDWYELDRSACIYFLTDDCEAYRKGGLVELCCKVYFTRTAKQCFLLNCFRALLLFGR